MRQRPEIQEVLRGGDRAAAGAAPVRNLHGVLRWLGGGEYPRARDEARAAVPFPGRGLLHDLRAEAGRALRQLGLRLADARQTVPRGAPSVPTGGHDSPAVRPRWASVHTI